MPFVVAVLVMAAGLTWTIHLIVSPEPWAADSATAIALGTLVFSIAAMTALLLSRGRWTRFFAIGLILTEMAIALVGEFERWLVASMVLSGLALLGLFGPWLKGWLRERPAAGSPGVESILLAIGSYAMVPLVGLAAPSGLEAAHGALGAVAVLLCWGYVRGGNWALLGLRFGLPLLVVLAAVSSPPGGATLLLAGGAAVTYLAWTPPARLAIDPAPELPAPRRRRT
jgi:hypothetical protein